jgi:ABC-type branched-subunit amino acid transport system ATPase component
MSRVRCERLSKQFGSLCALNCVTLDFPECGIVALIGPNGAGKSTLLNVISGFVRPDVGHCYVNEIRVTGWTPERIAALGVRRTFQAVRVFPEMTVSENVLVGYREDAADRVLTSFRPGFRRKTEQEEHVRATECLRSVELLDRSTEVARKLSYGQQKLLSLAICLASRAGIILLDEPVSGVDPETSELVLKILREMRQAKKLVVFIEHDLAAVRRVADEVHVLAGGAIVRSGTPEEVFASKETLELYFG